MRPTDYRSPMRDRTRRLLPWLALVAVVIGFLNFVWLFAESSTVGDAQRGYVRDGRYYLVHAGVATEVSRERWDWSQMHAASLLLTHPLAMAGGAYLLFTVVFPSMVGGGEITARRERVVRIRSSGVVVASERTGGRIGELRASRPLVRVDVHPGGAIIAVIGLEAIGLEAASLTDVASGRSFGASTIRIAHRQPDTPTEIHFYLGASSPVAQALRDLIPGVPGAASPVASAPEWAGITSLAPYPTVMKAMILAGLGLNVAFLIVAMPFGRQLGGFGVVWSIGLVLILGYNVWNYLIRNRHRW